MTATQFPEVALIGLDSEAGGKLSSEEARHLLGVLSPSEAENQTYTRVTIAPPSGEKLYMKSRLFG
jgi:hypothetical protein